MFFRPFVPCCVTNNSRITRYNSYYFRCIIWWCCFNYFVTIKNYRITYSIFIASVPIFPFKKFCIVSRIAKCTTICKTFTITSKIKLHITIIIRVHLHKRKIWIGCSYSKYIDNLCSHTTIRIFKNSSLFTSFIMSNKEVCWG